MPEPQNGKPFGYDEHNGNNTPELTVTSPVADYEVMLDRDRRWALNEGSRHFDEDSAVFKALRRVAERLEGLGIPYAVVGGMALFEYGLRRFTEVVDILVTREGLAAIHDKLEGRGYRPPFANSKNLRDTESGVKIEFLVTGEYPGDGKKKPVAFPDPSNASVLRDGTRYVTLRNLIELKLASGMTNPGRLKDLADVQELIKAINLPLEFNGELDASVRDQFVMLWRSANEYPDAE